MQVEISAMIEDYDILAYVSENKQAKVIDNIFYECAEESRREFIHGLDDSYLIEELEERGFTITKKRTTMDNKVFDFHEIKTFADACEKLGMKEHLLTGSMGGDREAQGQAQALYKLLIIQKAINNGVWRDKDGLSYYPYWVLYSKKKMERMSEYEKQRNGIRQLLSCAAANIAEYAGVRGAFADFRDATADFRNGTAYTDSGFPLCFNSKKAALYAAHQFEDLFFQYYGIKVKAYITKNNMEKKQYNKWISVKDELPEYEEVVLVCNEDEPSGMWFASRSSNPYEITDSHKFVCFGLEVTHWTRVKPLNRTI